MPIVMQGPRAALLTLYSIIAVFAADYVSIDIRTAANAALEANAKNSALERFVKLVRPACSTSSDAGIAATLLAIDVLLTKRHADRAGDRQITSFIELLEGDNATRLRGNAQRLRLLTLQGTPASVAWQQFNEIMKAIGTSGRDGVEGAEIAYYFAQAALRFGDIDRA